MFDKILIANRGEIACRVTRTAQAMGVKVVAVYSEADAASLHVELADEAVLIGGAAVADSYLRGDRIIAAALAQGAEAIHPGYGFLSENPDFVEAVERAGLIFIGPSASAIKAMGLKDAAKALMQNSGVPVVPGYHGANQDAGFLAGEAEKIGYPVLIKAVAGGGGKGMRRVEIAADFAADLASAQREAQAAFGNADVLIEKYVDHPRHIEVQVFGDGQKAVYLYERDCSLQRRHQKVIEEAPAPGMTPAMRAAMGQAAVRAAEAVGYAGAGTVEFIVDASDGLHADRFYFMEMNTRLQVEHPVTEAITGIDLVAWQLRVAAGEPLPMAQADIPLLGHSFEARLYAEDVAGGFLPATGTLAHLSFPKEIRADTGVRTGDEISPWYDPMIAKVIVQGRDRKAALAAMQSALAGTVALGAVTNLNFLRALCRQSDFQAGDVDTGLIERHLAELLDNQAPPAAAWGLAALKGFAPDAGEHGFRLWQPARWSVDLGFGADVRRIERRVEICFPEAGQAETTVDGEVTKFCHRAGRWQGPNPMLASLAGDIIGITGEFQWAFERIDPLARQAAASASDDTILSPMPGQVKLCLAKAGQVVKKGQVLLVLEAMKMEHSLQAPRDGVIGELFASEGDQVTGHMALLALQPLDGEASA